MTYINKKCIDERALKYTKSIQRMPKKKRTKDVRNKRSLFYSAESAPNQSTESTTDNDASFIQCLTHSMTDKKSSLPSPPNYFLQRRTDFEGKIFKTSQLQYLSTSYKYFSISEYFPAYFSFQIFVAKTN